MGCFIGTRRVFVTRCQTDVDWREWLFILSNRIKACDIAAAWTVGCSHLLCICWIDSFWCRCSARCWCKHQILQLRARASRSNDAEVLGDLGWAQPLRGTAGVWSWLHLGYPVLFGPQCVLHQCRNQKFIIFLDGCRGPRTNSISKNISIRFIMFITYFQMYAK